MAEEETAQEGTPVDPQEPHVQPMETAQKGPEDVAHGGPGEVALKGQVKWPMEGQAKKSQRKQGF